MHESIQINSGSLVWVVRNPTSRTLYKHSRAQLGAQQIACAANSTVQGAPVHAFQHALQSPLSVWRQLEVAEGTGQCWLARCLGDHTPSSQLSGFVTADPKGVSCLFKPVNIPSSSPQWILTSLALGDRPSCRAGLESGADGWVQLDWSWVLGRFSDAVERSLGAPFLVKPRSDWSVLGGKGAVVYVPAWDLSMATGYRRGRCNFHQKNVMFVCTHYVQSPSYCVAMLQGKRRKSFSSLFASNTKEKCRGHITHGTVCNSHC